MRDPFWVHTFSLALIIPLCDMQSIGGFFTGPWTVTRLFFTARCRVDHLLKVRHAAVLTPPFLFLRRRRVVCPLPPPPAGARGLRTVCMRWPAPCALLGALSAHLPPLGLRALRGPPVRIPAPPPLPLHGALDSHPFILHRTMQCRSSPEGPPSRCLDPPISVSPSAAGCGGQDIQDPYGIDLRSAPRPVVWHPRCRPPVAVTAITPPPVRSSEVWHSPPESSQPYQPLPPPGW